MWFCTDVHYHDGDLKPMYVTDRPVQDHADWLKAKKECNASFKDLHKKNDKSNKSKKSHSNQITLSENLKAAMLTKAGVTGSLFDSVWEEAVRESGNE